MKRPKKTPLDQQAIAHIVGNGIMMSDSFGGRAISVLILDESVHPEVGDAIRAASTLPPGDAETAWGVVGRDPALVVTLVRPVSKELVIPFPMPDYAALVEAIRRTEVVYLQAGKPGDRVLKSETQGLLLVRVANEWLEGRWPELFIRAQMEELKRSGTPALRARGLAERAYEAVVVELGSLRLPPDSTAAD